MTNFYKKNILLLVINLLFSIILFSQTTIAPSNSLIQYTGRVNFETPSEPRFAYSGVSIKVKFTGTQIKGIFNSTGNRNYFYIIVDDADPYKINITSNVSVYTLAEGLVDGEHTVEIYKITELSLGVVSFSGFEIDDNASILALPPKSTRKIEFIGDSITCGYGVEAGSRYDPFIPEEENFYLTYAAITARALNAQQHAVCFSGKGVYRNYDGPFQGSPDALPTFYDKIIQGQSAVWDFNTYQPAVVCINLGTNDFSTSGGDYQVFENTYRNFLNTLRGYYPNSKLVCLIGSMLYGNNLVTQRNILSSLANEFNTNGDPNVYFFEMSPQGSLGYGASWHPSSAQQAYNANELTAFLRTITGWESSLMTATTLLDQLSVYPIPANDKLIHVDGVLEELESTIYDMSGRLVFKKSLINTNNTLNLENLEKGIYFLRLLDKNNNIKTSKIVLK